MGLGVAGVDLLPSANGLLVMEVNSSPGLEGIQKSTGIDVAGEIIEYLENQAQIKSAFQEAENSLLNKIS